MLTCNQIIVLLEIYRGLFSPARSDKYAPSLKSDLHRLKELCLIDINKDTQEYIVVDLGLILVNKYFEIDAQVL